jgi:hypothetical protein
MVVTAIDSFVHQDSAGLSHDDESRLGSAWGTGYTDTTLSIPLSSRVVRQENTEVVRSFGVRGVIEGWRGGWRLHRDSDGRGDGRRVGGHLWGRDRGDGRRYWNLRGKDWSNGRRHWGDRG